MPFFPLRILSFGIIGATNTVAYAAICAVLLRCGVPAVAASLLAYTVCCPWSYWANARFTFGSRAAHAVAAPRFLATTMVSACIAVAIPFIMTDRLGFSAVVSVALTCAAVPLVSYAVAELYVFPQRV
jgi:putative flippase GtrA